MTDEPSEEEIHSANHNPHEHEHPSDNNYDILSDVYNKLQSGKPFKVAHGEHPAGKFKSVREAEYKGHHIVIKTLYEIDIDGKSYNAHFDVDNNGIVRCHALPNYEAPSTVDLIERLIDRFPHIFQKNESKKGES